MKKIIIALLFFIAIPAAIALGIIVFKDRSYIAISLIIALLACVPFFISFEKSKHTASELVVVAVITAISVLGRVIFYPVPGFKPITAVIIIAAASLGAQCGFVTGAMSALVSNIFFGQGPWTPFQMLAWGMLGFITGLICKSDKMKKTPILAVVGVLGGMIFSLTMDIWAVISFSGSFNWQIYGEAVLASLPFIVIYAVSNVIFILLLNRAISSKLNRIKLKYDIFNTL